MFTHAQVQDKINQREQRMSDLLKKKARDRASEMARRGKKEGDESDEEEVEDLKVYDAPDQSVKPDVASSHILVLLAVAAVVQGTASSSQSSLECDVRSSYFHCVLCRNAAPACSQCCSHIRASSGGRICMRNACTRRLNMLAVAAVDVHAHGARGHTAVARHSLTSQQTPSIMLTSRSCCSHIALQQLTAYCSNAISLRVYHSCAITLATYCTVLYTAFQLIALRCIALTHMAHYTF
eukprot:14942-Heterococcus_DN1.PRE.5